MAEPLPQFLLGGSIDMRQVLPLFDDGAKAVATGLPLRTSGQFLCFGDQGFPRFARPGACGSSFGILVFLALVNECNERIEPFRQGVEIADTRGLHDLRTQFANLRHRLFGSKASIGQAMLQEVDVDRQRAIAALIERQAVFWVASEPLAHLVLAIRRAHVDIAVAVDSSPFRCVRG